MRVLNEKYIRALEQSWNCMSIKLKLVCAFSFMLFSTFCLGLFSVYNLGKVNDLSLKTSNYWLPSIQYLSEANYFSAGYRRAEYEHILEGEAAAMEKMKDKMQARSEKYLAALEKFEAVVESEDDKAKISNLRSAWADYLKESETVVNLSKTGKKEEALSYMRGNSNKAFDKVTKALEEIISFSNEGGDAAGKESTKTFEQARILVYSLLGILIVVGVFLSTYLTKGIQATIQDTLKQVMVISQEVASVAENLFSASEQLSASSQQQASAIQETASSTEEITSMIARTADNANSAKEITNNCLTSADSGKSSVESMTKAIHEISASNQEISVQVEKSNQDLKNIVSLIEEIGSKTKVINDIVFQTKLLSFNASVEAARAGDAGKGFSVVAEEVGNLATMSGKAAEEISHLLEDSIRKVSDVAESTQTKVTAVVSNGKQKINYGIQIAEKCQASLNDILTNSHQSLERVTEIDSASSQQTTGIDEIRRAIHELSTGIQNTAESTHSVASSAKTLKEHMTNLNRLVGELATGKKAG